MLSIVLLLCSSCNVNKATSNVTTDKDSVNTENPVISAIMKRRSIRKYFDKAVSEKDLKIIAECGINAPSAMNKQPWEVRIVNSSEYINGISDIFRKYNPKIEQDSTFKNMFRNAPCVIFICAQKNGNGQFDCGLLSENIMLAAQSIGLGTCCLGSPIRFMKENKECEPYIAKLNISEDYELLYAIAVGYPDEEPSAKPRDAERIQFVE